MTQAVARRPRRPEKRGDVGERGVSSGGLSVYAEVGGVVLHVSDNLVEAPFASYVHSYARSLGLIGALDRDRGVVKYSGSRGVVEEVKRRVLDLLDMYGEEKLYVLYINANLVDCYVDFTDKYASIRTSPLFTGVSLARWYSGSPREPVFVGVVAVVSGFDPELISDNVVDYVELPNTPEAVGEVEKLMAQFNKLSPNEDDWRRWWRIIKESLLDLRSRVKPPTAVVEKPPAITPPPGLIPVKTVISRMPTEYIREVRDKPEVVSKLRTIRKKFYDQLHDYAYKAYEHWVLFHDAYSDAVLKLIDDLHGELESLGFTGKYIWLLDTWLPREYIVEGLREYLEERRELYKKLLKEEQEAKTLTTRRKREIERDKAKLEKEIKKLERELHYLTTL